MSNDRKAKRVGPADPAAILREIDEQSVLFDGKTMSKREAQLSLDYVRSINGDSRASVRLQRVRDRCGPNKVHTVPGCLLVPETPSLEEFKIMAFEQQRQFREKPFPDQDP